MFDIKENLKKLPDKPGVYMHKDKLGQIIYVGKAISLRNRVRQYFQSSANSNLKVKAMVSHIAEFEYITCQTEMEALILECNLIKKYMPKYNVLLRDDKTYPYIMVTVTEDFPRIIKTRTIKKDGNRYFGPYSDVGAVNQIVDLLSKIYALKKCSLKEFPYNHRPCLNYHINQCKGICTGKVSRQEYMDSIEKIIHFLSGKDKPILNYLEEKMSEASENLEFEEAAKYRDDILAVKAISVTQRVTMTNDKDLDIVLPVKDSQNSFVVLFSVRQGKLSGRETFQIQTTESDNRQEMVYEFIKQYYSQWAMVPPEILIEKELPEKEILEDFLSSEGRKVKILVPQKGDKKALLSLAQSDTLEMLKTLSEKAKNNNEKKLTIIQLIKNVIIHAGFEPRILDEDSQGYRVESYDISNTNGVDTVGAMVVFEGIKPIRKGYRRFKIKTVEGQNDYGSLQEVLLRRFKRAKSGDDSFNILPDIILIDGGIGQVTAAYKVLDSLGIDLPVVGMAKDDSHRTRALVFEDGSEVLLKDKPILFKYAGTVQEEVHRFAIEYHRTLRNKNTINSILENIEGVGPTRRNALLNHFKTIEAIKKATVAELCNVPTITESIAINIKEYFS